MDERVDDHPIAELFPLMSDDEIQSLADDIKANGQRAKIVLYEGKILDGRNRYRACSVAKVEPQFTTYAGKTPLEFVVGLNLHRRHLTQSQRAIVADKIATLKAGEIKSAFGRITQPEAAKTLGVSVRSVQRARAITEADPKKAEEVAAGKKTLVTAEREIKEAAKAKASDKLPKDERGVTLPADKVALWNRRDEIGELASFISKVRVAIGKAQDKGDILFRSINCSSAIAHLDQAYADLSGAKPYCVCPMCQGKGCRACKDTGLLGRFAFKQIVPRELKREDER